MKKTCILVLALLLFLTGCDIVMEQVQTVYDEVEPTIVAEAEKVKEDIEKDAEKLKVRAEVIARAEAWVLRGVKYGSFDDDPNNNYVDGYRADCSGLISYAWQLKKNDQPTSPTTDTLSSYAADISYEDLQPGDFLNNKGGGVNGHVVLFVAWIDQAHTQFTAIEENGYYGKTVQTTLNLVQKDGMYTIKEYESDAPGPYYAQSMKEEHWNLTAND